VVAYTEPTAPKGLVANADLALPDEPLLVVVAVKSAESGTVKGLGQIDGIDGRPEPDVEPEVSDASRWVGDERAGSADRGVPKPPFPPRLDDLVREGVCSHFVLVEIVTLEAGDDVLAVEGCGVNLESSDLEHPAQVEVEAEVRLVRQPAEQVVLEVVRAMPARVDVLIEAVDRHLVTSATLPGHPAGGLIGVLIAGLRMKLLVLGARSLSNGQAAIDYASRMKHNQCVLVGRPREAIAVITLNRPDRLNAVTFEVVDGLHEALAELDSDPACHVIVLTGEGRGFCSGIDLKGDELAEHGDEPTMKGDPRSEVDRWMLSQKHIAGLVTRIRKTRQPVIAAVNGPAYGVGMALACASDIRIAAQSARFCVRFISTGVGGCDIAISYTLPRLIGASRAHELILSGRVIDADQALTYGLVCDVSPDDAILDSALEIAGRIAAYPPFAVAMTKEVLLANLDAQSVENAMLMENRNQMLTAASAGLSSAITAFADRRWSTLFE